MTLTFDLSSPKSNQFIGDLLQLKPKFSFGKFYYFESSMPTDHTTPISGVMRQNIWGAKTRGVDPFFGLGWQKLKKMWKNFRRQNVICYIAREARENF